MSPVQQIIQQDLSKGSNVVTQPYLIGDKQAVLDINMLLDEHGSLRTRDGTLIESTSPDVAAAGAIRPIVKLFDFVKIDGTIRKLAIVFGALVNTLYDRGTVPWTFIGDFTTAYRTPDMLTFTQLALIASGYETPWSLTAAGVFAQITALGGQTVPPGGKHHTLHQGFYWLWNTSAATTTLDGKSSLRSSDLNNPNSWPNAAQIFIDKDDGDEGMGMGQFTIAETGISPTTSQILFKTFASYQMTGVFGSTSPAFAIQKIKSDMGCVAPRSIHFAPGFGLVRLAHRGFALFDGVDDRLISEEIRPLLFGTGGFTGIDWSNVSLAWGEVNANPPFYLCFAPVAGAALTRCFMYDLVRRAWTVLQFANSVATVKAIEDPGTLPVLLAGDYGQGRVRRMFAGDPDDDGVAIDWQTILRPIAASKSPQQRGYIRRMIAKVTNVVAGQQITGQFVFGPTLESTPVREVVGVIAVPVGTIELVVPGDFSGGPYTVKALGNWFSQRTIVAKTGASFTIRFNTPAPAPPAPAPTLSYTVAITPVRFPAQKTETKTLPVSAGAFIPLGLGYGQGGWGTSPYGGTSTAAPEVDLTWDLGLLANNVRGLLSGRGQLTIRGIEWHVKAKPVARPTISV